VHDDEIPFSHNRSGLIFESRRKALDEIEQALTTGSNVRAVLDVSNASRTSALFFDSTVRFIVVLLISAYGVTCSCP
jgi:hypothetical protein